MEHRAASHNERAHRIGLAGLGRFECRPQRADTFRIEKLVHGLARFDFPGDASRSRALCAGLLDARAAHTGTLRHDKAALAVHLTGKEIDEAHQLVSFDIVAVARRIPAVVTHAAEIEKVTSRFDDSLGRDSGLLGHKFGRVLGIGFLEGNEHGASMHALAVGKVHFAVPIHGGQYVGRFVKADRLSLFVELGTLEGDVAGVFVNDGKVALATALLDHVFGNRRVVIRHETRRIRPLAHPFQIAEVFTQAYENQTVQESGVGTGLDRNPFGFAQCTLGHARVDEHQASAIFARLCSCREHTHGAVQSTPYEKQITNVEVIGLNFSQARESRTENEATRKRGSRVAGCRVIDHIGRSEGRRKPVLIGREVVARENHTLFAVLGDDGLEFGCDFVERLIPGNFFELTAAAFALAL